MASGRAPWTEKALELMRDGPVEKELLVAQIIKLVPPGKAWRDYLRTAMRNKRRYFYGDAAVLDDEELAAMRPTDHGIRVGQRQIVMSSLSQMVRMGRLAMEDRDGQRYYSVAREVHTPGRKERSDVVRKAWQSRDREVQAQRMAQIPPEVRSEWIRKSVAARSPQERSEIARKGWFQRKAQARRREALQGGEAWRAKSDQ